jgi:Flp pilus assembly protein TadD/mono/diheme cytochrome c family protein
VNGENHEIHQSHESHERATSSDVSFVSFVAFPVFALFVFFVVFLAGCSRPDPYAAASQPTFTRDIAPIVYTNCATCHRPGEAAPFSLLTYADVKGRARQIAEVTSDRYMPPWPPEPGHGEFEGERRLSDAQIATIKRWVDAGAPEGDPGDLPPQPSFPSGWHLGRPDLVVAMPKSVDVPAEGLDVFRTVIVPVAIDSPKYVRAVEFRPGSPRSVHHAMVRLAADAGSRRPDPGSRVIASEGMLGAEEDIVSPDGHVIGWAPGYSPNVGPRGMAWRLDPGTSIAIELHLQTTGKPEQVQSSVGLFFTNEAPTTTPFGLQLGSYTIDIPPGEREYTIEDRYELPVDVDLLAIYPHAHYLGKELRAMATLPDGTERSLIWIKDWDFNWQNAYRYRAPVRLPRGTIVRMRYVYDNSADNPRNPSSPPRRVRYGGQSTDEMGNLWMQVVPAAGDLAALRDDYSRKSAQRDIDGYEWLVKEYPHQAGMRRALGAAYLRAGRVPDAVRVLEEAVRLAPRDATVQYNLGHALAASGRMDQALQRFRNAGRLQPSFAEAHNNVGALLRQSGHLAQAETAFRAAVAADPAYAPAHSNLGSVRRLRGDRAGAVASLQEAVRLDPAYAEAHYNLGLLYYEAEDRAAATRHLRRVIELQPQNPQGYNAMAWLLATAPDRTPAAIAEAVTLAQRAATLTGGKDASALDTLAAAYAAAGDLDRAAAAAERALQVAKASGQTALAADISGRLTSYRARR